jgi:hypothetical protein
MATDIDCVQDADLYGSFAPEEIEARGQLHTLISHDHVKRASDRVLKSGVLEMLSEWHRMDNPTEDLGGRPRIIGEHAIIVGMLLLAQEHSSLFMRKLAALFQHRLTPESRTLLSLPTQLESFSGKSSETTRWEKNTNNTFHHMLGAMDPFPINRRYSLTYAQVKQVIDNHDEEREHIMKGRLDLFTNAFLRMTFMEQPKRVREATAKLDISFDQTFIKPPTKKGYSKKKLAQKVKDEAAGLITEPRPGPVDPFAAWYPLKGDHLDLPRGTKDTTGPEDAKKLGTDLAWGYMINIAVRVDSEKPGKVRFPKLAVAATMSLPNVGVSEEAVELMRASLGMGLPPGLGDADKQYWANAKPERLHLPAEGLGLTASTDYRVDRLGPQGKPGEPGSKGGIEFLEDGAYCPGTPGKLKTATRDVVNGIIEEDVFQVRRGERRAFLVHQKERPDANGRRPVACPPAARAPPSPAPSSNCS